MAKGKIIAGSILLVFMAIVALVFILMASSASGSGPFQEKNKVVCQVEIDEKLIGQDIDIESAKCRVAGSCGVFSLLSLSGQVEGKAQLYDGDKRLDSQDFDNDLFTGKASVNLQGCTNANELTVLLFRDEGLFGKDDAVDFKVVGVN